MSNLVDFHSHFFSRVFFETLARASTLPGTADERLVRVTEAAGVELPPRSTEEHVARWIRELDRFGVAHMLTFASVPEEASVVSEAVALSRGRLSALCVVDPTRPEAPERVEALLSEHGFRGVLTFPAMHGYSADGPELAAVLEVLGRHGAIAVVHCGLLRVSLRDRFGLPGDHDIARANPLALIPAASRHPDVRFVIPHFGAGFLRETLLAGAQCANILVDTSSSNGWLVTQPERLTLADVFDRCLRVFGPTRILFGTDSSVFPRGWRRDVLMAQREALGACGVSEADRSRILGDNAAELLGLRG